MSLQGARDYRRLSLWHDTLDPDDPLRPRARLPGSLAADVAIVGGGFTGLWTAYYLRRLDPSLRVVVLEREVAGFGASGRNGGWCSSLLPVSLDALAAASSRADAIRMQRAMDTTVDDVGRVVAAEGIDAHWAKGGAIELARSRLQWDRARSLVAQARSWGFGSDDIALLDATEAAAVLDASHTLGGVLVSHCAAIHPGRLVRGLAQAAERAGARVYEHTPVEAIEPGRARTPHGDVRADVVVRATEGYTAGLPGLRRTIAPVYSAMIATEPLPDDVWERTGLSSRTTFTDLRHMVIYGQRTVDGRLAFGGRGAPYRLGSRVTPQQDVVPSVWRWLERTLHDMLPETRGVPVTHRWAGPLGISRDWWPSVGLDRRRGLAWAGGYVGDGVATSHLAGRTLADLVLGRDTDLVDLPWVGHRSPPWEPEPLRWLGLNAGLTAMGWADPEESTTHRPSVIASAFGRLMHG
jgi:glycine/D-amino acid oxidase-like deaminating enzyme